MQWPTYKSIYNKASHCIESFSTIYTYRKYFMTTFWHIVVDNVHIILVHMQFLYISNMFYQINTVFTKFHIPIYYCLRVFCTVISKVLAKPMASFSTPSNLPPFLFSFMRSEFYTTSRQIVIYLIECAP